MNQRKDMALNNTKGLLFVQKGKQQKQRDFLRDKKSSKREEISSKRLSSHFERGRNDINIMPANRPANTNNSTPIHRQQRVKNAPPFYAPCKPLLRMVLRRDKHGAYRCMDSAQRRPAPCLGLPSRRFIFLPPPFPSCRSDE